VNISARRLEKNTDEHATESNITAGENIQREQSMKIPSGTLL
jgi:hypothetical protein